MSLQLLFIEKASGRDKNNLERMKSLDLRGKYALNSWLCTYY